MYFTAANLELKDKQNCADSFFRRSTEDFVHIRQALDFGYETIFSLVKRSMLLTFVDVLVSIIIELVVFCSFLFEHVALVANLSTNLTLILFINVYR
jgi:hypothetical protein